MVDWTLVTGFVVACFLVGRALAYLRKLSDVQYIAGPRYIFSLFSLPGALLPSTSWNGGFLFTWVHRRHLYLNREIIAVVPYLYGPPVLLTCAPETAKQVLTHRKDWDKPSGVADVLAPYGENLLSATQDRWGRHRRIVNPGFNNRLYANVWAESVNTYYAMLDSWTSERSEVVPDVTAMTAKISLLLIASCGFGMPLQWNDDASDKIRGMSLQECFHVAGNSALHRLLLPKWMFRLPIKTLRRIVDAHEILESALNGIIMRRRLEGPTGIAEENDKDVFSLLLNANEAEKDGKATLSDRELISNVFLLMLAGHETTSRGLAATLGLLACHPEEQEKAHQEIHSVCRDVGDPTIHDYGSLPFVLGCFYEAMRLYPSVNLMSRRATEDCVLSVGEKNGMSTEMPVKRDTLINLDLIGMCYNPRLYPSPDSYIPSRWLSPTVEPLMNFSYGPRVCIGKRFAVTEAVAILSLIIRDWRIEPLLEEGETNAEWRKRALDDTVTAQIGFGPGPFPLKFIRREKAHKA